MRISDWSSDVCSSDLLDRRARDHHAVKVGALRHRRADENAAVRAARDRDLALGADAGLDEILGDGVEIVEAVLAFFAQRRLMPRGAIFAAPAAIGEDLGITVLDPEQAERSAQKSVKEGKRVAVR